MALQDFIADLPAEKQESFKAELGKYAEIATIDKLPEFQRQLSLKHEASITKWHEEKKPALIEEEIKKRTTKDPTALRLEELEKKLAEKDRQMILGERRSQAIAELSKHGLDASLADYVLDADEEQFKQKIENLTGKVTSWRDEQIKKLKTEAFNQSNPQGGNTGGLDFSKMSTTEIMQYAQKGPAEMAAVLAHKKK